MASGLVPHRSRDPPTSRGDPLWSSSGADQGPSGPGSRSGRGRSTLLLVALTLLLVTSMLLAATGVHGHASGDPHPHVVLTLTHDGAGADDADDGTTSGHLALRWVGSLTVNETDDGTRYVEVAVPWTGDALERFEPSGGWSGTGTSEVVVDPSGATDNLLRWTWESGAPEPGQVLEEVEVEMGKALTFTPDAAFRWQGLGGQGAAVTVDVPEHVDVLHDRMLIKSTHHDPVDGRQSYFQTRLDGPLELTFRPAGADAVDAGRAAPPWPGWSWTIIIGLAAASALVWWVGYRIDERRAEREARDAEERERSHR